MRYANRKGQVRAGGAGEGHAPPSVPPPPNHRLGPGGFCGRSGHWGSGEVTELSAVRRPQDDQAGEQGGKGRVRATGRGSTAQSRRVRLGKRKARPAPAWVSSGLRGQRLEEPFRGDGGRGAARFHHRRGLQQGPQGLCRARGQTCPSTCQAHPPHGKGARVAPGREWLPWPPGLKQIP